MSSSSQPLAPDADRTAADDAPQCPLCDYDLRGLIEPRCPECGYAFDWADLRDPARRKHKYLFEHHPERNAWSFVRTLLGGLRPRKFWGGLLPSQPSRPGRLIVYALIVAAAVLLAPAAMTAQLFRVYWVNTTAQRSNFIASLSNPATLRVYQRARPGGTPQQVADQFIPAPSPGRFLNLVRGMRAYQRAIIVHAVVLLWPPLTLAALMIFQWSMRRARVHPSHFARCVVYSADVLLWANLLLTLVMTAHLLRQALLRSAAAPLPVNSETYGIAATCAAAAALLVFGYRLIVALKAYVRFDHPAATILSSQLIVLLVVLILVTVSMPM